jgi:hypothetical protein
MFCLQDGNKKPTDKKQGNERQNSPLKTLKKYLYSKYMLKLFFTKTYFELD